MAGINIYFQVTNKNKQSWGWVGELTAYDMDGVTLKHTDNSLRTYLHEEVVPFPLTEIKMEIPSC